MSTRLATLLPSRSDGSVRLARALYHDRMVADADPGASRHGIAPVAVTAICGTFGIWAWTMRIVVTGLVASFPLGGVAWDYLAYVDGFRRLGCDVLYLEDTGQWVYDPRRETFTEDASDNLALAGRCAPHGRHARGAFAVSRSRRHVPRRRAATAVTRFCRSADLFLNVSGSCWLRDEYRGARCTAYLDSDPGYTQAKLLAQERGRPPRTSRSRSRLIRHHDRFFTFAENMGQPDCADPDSGLAWIPTRQPVVLERWPFSFDARARADSRR